MCCCMIIPLNMILLAYYYCTRTPYDSSNDFKQYIDGISLRKKNPLESTNV